MSFVPLGEHTFFVIPFKMDGVTKSGFELIHHDKLPICYGRATRVHPSCQNVRSGDWCLFLPGRPTRLTSREGPLYVLDERLVLGIVEPGDGRPWFVEETKIDQHREALVDERT